jgi:hypothetical protein
MRKSFWANLSVNITLKVIIFILIIIQSCGIRFISGQGSILVIVVLFLSRKGFKFIKIHDILFLIVLFLILSFICFLNPSFSFKQLIFQVSLIIEAYIFLKCYEGNFKALYTDFFKALHVIFLHSLIGYLFYLIIPSVFVNVSFGYSYKTLGYLFFVTQPIGGQVRNTGLLWEPGLLQLMLNLYLFYAIKTSRAFWTLILAVFVIITTFSTAGFITLGLNLILFIHHNYRINRKLVLRLLIIIFIMSGSLVFVGDNILDKFSGENTSGLVRYRDYLIGRELISEKPLLGHGLYDEAYLKSKKYTRNIENNLFTSEYFASSEDMAGGFTNGFLALITWYGIPISIVIYTLFFLNYFVDHSVFNKIIYFLIVSFSLISEPITYTVFFLMFPLSFIVFYRSENKGVKTTNNVSPQLEKQML